MLARSIFKISSDQAVSWQEASVVSWEPPPAAPGDESLQPESQFLTEEDLLKA
jgi:hypothetical protein